MMRLTSAGLEFESLVSFEGCKTKKWYDEHEASFESLVSFEGCKTQSVIIVRLIAFESLVSFEGCKTRLNGGSA